MKTLTSTSIITKAAFAVSAVAVVGTLAVATGVGAAQVKPVGDIAPVSKDECKKGGHEDFGFKNQGQCVSYVVHENKANGYGYGHDRDDDKDHGKKHHDNDRDRDQANGHDSDDADEGRTEANVQNSTTQNVTSGDAIGANATSGNVSVTNYFSTVYNFFAGLAS